MAQSQPRTLDKLLDPCGRGLYHWEAEIAAGDAFYRLLRDLFQGSEKEINDGLQDADKGLARWHNGTGRREIFHSERQRASQLDPSARTQVEAQINNALEQWKHARALLDCGLFLRDNPKLRAAIKGLQWDDSNAVLTVLGQLKVVQAKFNQEYPASACSDTERLVWILSLLNVPRLGPLISVPFATADLTDRDKSASVKKVLPQGYLNVLEIELFDYGFQYLGSHPSDFYTRGLVMAKLTEALQVAWETAIGALKTADPAATLSGTPLFITRNNAELLLRFGARWRILDEKGQPLTYNRDYLRIDGGSVGGAAVRAFHYALTGRVPDKEVLVMMSLNARGQFEPVASVAAKTQAALASEKLPIDTIVVLKMEAEEGKTTNQQEAEAAISAAQASHRIRVKVLG